MALIIPILPGIGGLLLGLVGGFRAWGLIAAFVISPLVMFLTGVEGMFVYFFAIMMGAFLGQVLIKIIP